MEEILNVRDRNEETRSKRRALLIVLEDDDGSGESWGEWEARKIKRSIDRYSVTLLAECFHIGHLCSDLFLFTFRN